MIIALFLLFLGLLLIFLEIFLPVGIFGIIGGLILVGAILIFALVASALWIALLFVALTVLLLIGLVKFTLWGIKKGRNIFLHQDQEGYFASTFPADAIGKKGIALSDLKPAGHIEVEGQRYQAISKGGYIHKGETVFVIGGEGSHLTVVEYLSEKL